MKLVELDGFCIPRCKFQNPFQWNLDSPFQSLVGLQISWGEFPIPKLRIRIPQAKNSQNPVWITLLEELPIFSWISARVLISNYSSKDGVYYIPTILESKGKEIGRGGTFSREALIWYYGTYLGGCLLEHGCVFSGTCIVNMYDWFSFEILLFILTCVTFSTGWQYDTSLAVVS